MKILALILARGGSKRLPGKNIKPLKGKPLIVWSIESAKDIADICEILVSTDDTAIAEIAKENGGFVPWLRPDKLSDDNSSSVDASIHAIDWYEENFTKIDGLLLLQPTSPFRRRESIISAIDLFKSQQKTIVSVSLTHSHPFWTFKMSGNRLVPFFDNGGYDKRFQDLEPAYTLNGSIYLIQPERLRKNRSFFDFDSIALVTESQKEGLDIDTEFDFKVAELIFDL